MFDRSAPLPTGGYLEQAGGTAWIALFSLNKELTEAAAPGAWRLTDVSWLFQPEWDGGPQRLTCTGIAMHSGNQPGYPASHGCLRLKAGIGRFVVDTARFPTRLEKISTDLASGWIPALKPRSEPT